MISLKTTFLNARIVVWVMVIVFGKENLYEMMGNTLQNEKKKDS